MLGVGNLLLSDACVYMQIVRTCARCRFTNDAHYLQIHASIDELDVHVTPYTSPRPVRSFLHMGLHGALLKEITSAGYETPTPIQAQTIPVVLSGYDVIALAKTGSCMYYAVCLTCTVFVLVRCCTGCLTALLCVEILIASPDSVLLRPLCAIMPIPRIRQDAGLPVAADHAHPGAAADAARGRAHRPRASTYPGARRADPQRGKEVCNQGEGSVEVTRKPSIVAGVPIW